MTIPVWVEQQNGSFAASVPGVAGITAQGPDRAQVVESIRQQLHAGVSKGQLVLVDVDFVGVSGLAGRFRDDPTLQDICAEAYRLREEEKAAVIAEYDLN